MTKLILFTSDKDHRLSNQLYLIADYIYTNGIKEIYYVSDSVNESVEKKFVKKLSNLDYSFFNESNIVLPIDDMFIALQKSMKSVNVRYNFYFYNTYSIDRLKKELKLSINNPSRLDSIFTIDHFLCSNRLAADRISKVLKRDIEPIYLPFSSCLEQESIDLKVKNNVNIAWIGPIYEETMGSFISLCNDLSSIYEQYGKIRLHVVGGGSLFWKTDLSKFASKIVFIFPDSESVQNNIEYLRSNVDCIISVHRDLFLYANIGIPSYYMPINKTTFKGTYIQFCNLRYFDFEIHLKELSTLNYKQTTMKSIINLIYAENQKNNLSIQDYNIFNNYMCLEKQTEILINSLDQTSIDCGVINSNPVVIRQYNDYHSFLCKNKEMSYPDYLEILDFSKTKCNTHTFQIKIQNLLVKINNKNIFVCRKIQLILNKVIDKLIKFNNDSFKNVQNKSDDFLSNAYNLVKVPRFNHYYHKGIKDKKKKKQGKKTVRTVILKKLHYYKVQMMYAFKIRKIQSKDVPLKVAFIVLFDTVFPYRKIFEIMEKDPAFDPYIIVAPIISRTYKYQQDTISKTYQSLFADYGERVIIGFDSNSEQLYDLKDNYQIVFFSNPYKSMVSYLHHVEYFLDKDVLTVYANYGFEAVTYWNNIIDTDFYNYIWKVCIETEPSLYYLKKHEAIRGHNGIVTGYFKADLFSNYVQSNQSGKKTIIISPHHTVMGWKEINISNFLRYSDFFIRLPKLYPNIHFIFRPHPLLFPNLITYNIWNRKQIDDYFSSLLSSPNITYDQSADYSSLFVNSDAIIHDCGSFIGEYLFVDKPCCYMMKTLEETMQGLIPVGQECINNYYHAFNEEDIISFINEVVIGGKDPLSKSRKKFVEETLKINYPNSSAYFVDYLKAKLRK